MDKVTRKGLKTDRFAVEVTHSIEYVSEHRKQAIRYGGAALVVLVAGSIAYWLTQSRSSTRQADLSSALRNREAVVGSPQPGDPRPHFATAGEKDKAVRKGFEDVISRHSGGNESAFAHFQLGVLAADQSRLDEAARHFQAAVSEGNAGTASVAKLSLAQVLAAQGKPADAEKLLRELVASPTILVTKEQATFSLARVLAPAKPAEARKLVEPFQKDTRPAIARNAAALLSELPAN